jgi:hypothetical protein
MRNLYKVMKMFSNWIVMMVSQLCKFTKNIIQLKWVENERNNNITFLFLVSIH